MAEIAVQFTLKKLLDFLTKEAYFVQGVHERVTSLQKKFEEIRDLLKHIDAKCRKNDAVKRWMGQIREVACDAEDVIDSYSFNIAQQQGETSAGFMGSLRTFARGIKDIPAILQVGKKISDIESSLNEILSKRLEYGIDNIPASGEASSSSSSSSSNQSQTWREKRAPIVEEADVVGLVDEANRLVRCLTEGDARRAVISITGMGGLGKTTLAKKVYNDIRVKRSFGFHAWVYVSQEYQVRELLISLITCFRSSSRDHMEGMPEERLQRTVSEYLQKKKYLVVIDDIWTREAWDGLVTAFPEGGNGSRVLLTTRNEDIARYADPRSTPYQMRLLNENESWTLFLKKALPGNPAPVCPSNLDKLGREIVGKCGGLPLEIAVLGGVLSRKDKSVNEWVKLLKSVEWWLNESDDNISGILALSYYDLPYYLTPCFLYLGAFPENSEIDVDELIRLWIAEGFVQKRGEEEMEDVAEDYLNELISRSLIQVAKSKSNGTEPEKCHIHDLLRNLSVAKAKEERFLDVYGKEEPTSPTIARRLAITIHGGLGKSISLNRSTLHLRSFLRFNESWEGIETQVLKSLWGAFKFLRVMDLRHVGLTRLPDEIGSLFHLRYLSLMMTFLDRLPSTITRLSNLQTLNLMSKITITLPDDIWKMEQLRHLRVTYQCKFSDGTPLHRLSNLQTLRYVCAGGWTEYELEKLTNLRELWLCGHFNMASSRSISKLVHLRSFWLREESGSSIPAFESFSNHQHLYDMHLDGRLERLPDLHEFPPNLTRLHLNWSKLERDPMGTLEKLPNLRILEYHRQVYKTKEMVFSAGGFPLLNVLHIFGLDQLEEWRVEEGAMLNLTSLHIFHCTKLKMLPDGLRHLTTLQELTLALMPKEFEERVRENDGEDWFKIRHIPSVIFKDPGLDDKQPMPVQILDSSVS